MHSIRLLGTGHERLACSWQEKGRPTAAIRPLAFIGWLAAGWRIWDARLPLHRRRCLRRHHVVGCRQFHLEPGLRLVEWRVCCQHRRRCSILCSIFGRFIFLFNFWRVQFFVQFFACSTFCSIYGVFNFLFIFWQVHFFVQSLAYSISCSIFRLFNFLFNFWRVHFFVQFLAGSICCSIYGVFNLLFNFPPVQFLFSFWRVHFLFNLSRVQFIVQFIVQFRVQFCVQLFVQCSDGPFYRK